MNNLLKLKTFLAALGAFSALTACTPESGNPIIPGDGDGTITSSVNVGCGNKTGITMSCVSNAGQNLGNYNLGLNITCSAAQTATQVKLTTNFAADRSGCKLNNQTLKRQSLVLDDLRAKTGPGGVFEGDSDLLSMDRESNFEWKCTEKYSTSSTRDLSDFFHFITFQRDEGSNVVNGVLENRNIYVDTDGLEYDGSSRCSFQFNAI